LKGVEKKGCGIRKAHGPFQALKGQFDHPLSAMLKSGTDFYLGTVTMTDASAVTAGFFALVAAVFGTFSDDFYASSRAGAQGKKRPKWFGRLWFFGFAATMLYFSLSHFLQRK
jgi:hypothetical protein